MARRKTMIVKTFTHLEDLMNWMKSKEDLINTCKDRASIKIEYMKSADLWYFELLG
jgi:hypothetical protein